MRRKKVQVRMREKLQRFMAGRYGVDELSKFYFILTFVFLILSMITRVGIFYLLGIALLIYTYWRTFSKNISKRYEENQKYRTARYKVVAKWGLFKKHFAQRKEYRFFHCPTCKQKVRVPKGKGKICITCPKCRT